MTRHIFVPAAVSLCLLLMLPISAIAKPIVSIRTVHYDIRGISFRELRQHMYQQAALYVGVKNQIASTHYRISWGYKFQNNQGKCQIKSVTTTLNITLTFPQLDPLAPIPLHLQDTFNTYAKNLMIHENGHIEIDKKIADKIDQGIAALPPASSCDVLKKTANTLGHALLKEGRIENVEYDANTRHGAAQGARLVESPEAR